MKLRSAGTGYGFCQSRLNVIQQAAGLHALREQGPVGAIQTGTLDERADVKIKLIVRFFGNWIHFLIVGNVDIQMPLGCKTQKNRFHIIGHAAIQAQILNKVILNKKYYNIL